MTEEKNSGKKEPETRRVKRMAKPSGHERDERVTCRQEIKPSHSHMVRREGCCSLRMGGRPRREAGREKPSHTHTRIEAPTCLPRCPRPRAHTFTPVGTPESHRHYQRSR